MKTKILVTLFTLVFALAMMAQTATQATPAPAAGDNAKTCACCSGDKCPMKDGKMADGKSCCGKDGGCCKDGKCDMAAHKDGKMACCSGDKCPMKMSKSSSKDGKMAEGKSCCAGDKCPMMAKGKQGDHGCCCGNMSEHDHASM